MKYFVLALLLLVGPVVALYMSQSLKRPDISDSEWTYCMRQPGNDATFCNMFEITKVVAGTTYYKARQ